MRRLILLAILLGAPAFGQTPPDKVVKAPAEIQAPRPPAELAQLDVMVGTWTCEGKLSMNGKEAPMKSTYKISKELDGFWYLGKLDTARSKDSPTAFHALDYYSYDVGSKQFMMISFDNTGGATTMSSKGYVADKAEWAGKARIAGADLDSRMVVTKSGPRATHLSLSVTGPGFDEKSEIDCRK